MVFGIVVCRACLSRFSARLPQQRWQDPRPAKTGPGPGYGSTGPGPGGLGDPGAPGSLWRDLYIGGATVARACQ